jgi:ABC-type transport system substrate-binding protein
LENRLIPIFSIANIKKSAVTLALFSLLAMPGCCPDDPYANYLNLIVNTEPKSLDPALATDITTGVLTALMYDNLVQFGVKSEIEPALAESWQVSEDGKTYTFVLRDDVTFWDGSALTADDVSYSFHRVLAPETASSQVWLLEPIKGAVAYMQGNADNIDGIKIVNDYQLVLEMETSFSPFLGFLCAPATAIVAKPDSQNAPRDYKTDPLGTGPWIFDSWQADRQIKLKKFESYYNGPAKLDGIILNNIPEILTAAIEFEAGNLDIMTIPNSEFKYWTRSTVWQPHIQKLDELGMYYLAMNVDRAPFTDKRVRQAITYAIDREKIIYRIMHNSATLAHGPVPPGLLGYDSTRAAIPYDPKKAKLLLKEAGYENGCEFDLWVDPGAAISQTIEAIQHYLSEAGFIVHLVRNDWNMMRDAMRKGETDAYWGNWWADYADAENFLAPLFHSKNAARRNRYNNPEVDALIERLQTSMDLEERMQITQKIESIIIDEAPYAFMWYPTSYTVSQPFLKNYTIHLMPNANKYTNVYFEKQ